MSKAEELLNELTSGESDIAITEPVGEPHIVIGSDRFITVPPELKRIAVQFDHNVETVIFDCPRYWDEHDMSQMIIYINYMRKDGYCDSYVAQNITVDETDSNIMHFTWTITRNATTVKGDLSFLVCVKKTNDSGEEVNHWNSELCQDMRVSEGLECIESIITPYPDLITQLLLRMDYVEVIASPGAIEKYVNDCLAADPLLREKMEEIITPEVIDNYVTTYLKNNQTVIKMISDGNGNVVMGLGTANKDSVTYTTAENSAGGMTLEIG